MLAEVTARNRREGHREGRREGFAEGIAAACALLDIELTAERRARMSELDASGLEAMLAQISAQRRFP